MHLPFFGDGNPGQPLRHTPFTDAFRGPAKAVRPSVEQVLAQRNMVQRLIDDFEANLICRSLRQMAWVASGGKPMNATAEWVVV
ncbi:MAG: hypothetical protein H6874_01865 [Hyphomicrobiaceae bacterium]|nr:hypothetical protein [Hyphomicrobiaceae bacterium]